MALIYWGEVNAAGDITMASIVNQQGTQTRSAIMALIQNVAASIISSNPTVIAAAEAAVANAMAAKRLMVETDLPAVRVLDVDDPVWGSVDLSYDFRIVGGVLRSDGSQVEPAPGYTFGVLSVGTGTVFLTNDYRRAEPGAEDTPDGLVPQDVLEQWASRMGLGQSGFVSLTGWGDSMTTDYMSEGNQTEMLAALLGVTGYDQGRSGDSGYQVAWRMGGLALRVTIADNRLPASGAVPVTVNVPTGWNQTREWPCVIRTAEGDLIQVILGQSSVNPSQTPTWSLRQSGGSEDVTIWPGTRIRFIVDEATMTSPAKFWLGRNDPNQGRVLRALRGMVSQHRDPRGRRLIAPIFNRAEEPAGSAGYATVMAINDAIAAEFGEDFFDDRSVLIQHGLDIAGLTPTAADLTAIAEDRIPPSLMRDTIHLNPIGRATLAVIDAIEIAGRNW